jgi:hypothetical protein
MWSVGPEHKKKQISFFPKKNIRVEYYVRVKYFYRIALQTGADMYQKLNFQILMRSNKSKRDAKIKNLYYFNFTLGSFHEVQQ